MAAAKSSEKQPSFEKALERLETIVRDMETGDLSLERMMAHFEEGMDLAKLCTVRLNEVERKIEQLVAQGDATRLEPFEPPADPAQDDGAERT